jgi:RNA polymerase sigma-70 factor, ECF subfamily
MTVEIDGEFEALIEREGRTLAGFILALVGDLTLADDLYQSTCLELWRIRRTFVPGTDFGAWSRSVARIQAMRHWRKAGREKVVFSSEAIERVSEAFAAPAGGDEPEAESERAREALAACVGGLPGEDRRLLERRYRDGTAVAALAAESGRSEAGLKMKLLRLRRRIGRCVRSRLAAREARPHG